MTMLVRFVGDTPESEPVETGRGSRWWPGEVRVVDDAIGLALVAAHEGWEACRESDTSGALTADEAKALRALVSGAWNLTAAQLATLSAAGIFPRGAVSSGVTALLAMYGDSRSNIGNNGTANTFDLRTWTSAAPTGSVAGASFVFRSGGAIVQAYPAAQIVANCGISGDTLALMATRESAGASATRKSLDDAWSTGARVLVFRAGINSITSLVTAGYVQATTDSIIAARRDLIYRAVNRGFLVLDEGEAGYDYVGDSGTFPQTRIDAIRQTIMAVNAAAASDAAASGGSIIYLNVWSLLCYSTGQWLPGMCEDTANPGQRLHPSPRAAQLVAQTLYKPLLSSLFGTLLPAYVVYGNGITAAPGNLLPNADLSASTSGLGTGWSHSGSGTGPTRTPSIRVSGGRRWQDLLCTFSGAGTNLAQLNAPMPIQSGGSITVAAGQVYGFEFDFMIDDGNGGAPPPNDAGSLLNARLRIYGAAGNVYYDAMAVNTLAVPMPDGPIVGKAVWAPTTMAESSAAITASTTFGLYYGTASASQFRMSISNPRMVRLS